MAISWRPSSHDFGDGFLELAFEFFDGVRVQLRYQFAYLVLSQTFTARPMGRPGWRSYTRPLKERRKCQPTRPCAAWSRGQTCRPCLGSHDRRHHAPLFRLVIIRALKKGLGIDIRSEDITLADRNIPRWFRRHDWDMSSNRSGNWNKTMTGHQAGVRFGRLEILIVIMNLRERRPPIRAKTS